MPTYDKSLLEKIHRRRERPKIETTEQDFSLFVKAFTRVVFWKDSDKVKIIPMER